MQAEYCGGFETAVTYGFPFMLENQKLLPLSPGECKRLVEDKKVAIDDRIFDVEDTFDFGFDWMFSGKRDTNGNCERGDPFTWKNTEYLYHARIASIHGSVKELIYEVDGATSMILIDGTAVNTSSGYFQSKGVTYIWESKDFRSENLQCSENVHQIFKGNGSIVTWSNDDKNTTMLVGGSHEQGQFFGVKLTSDELGICGRNSLVTDLPGVYIVILRTGDDPIPALKPVQFNEMSTFLQLQAIFGYNFVESTRDQTRALQVLVKKICTNEEQILQNKMGIILNNHDGRVGSVFNQKGVFSEVKGGVVYFTKCESVMVNFRYIEAVSGVGWGYQEKINF